MVGMKRFAGLVAASACLAFHGGPATGEAIARETTTRAEDAKALEPAAERKRAPAGKARLAARPPGEGTAVAAPPIERPFLSDDGKFTFGGAIRTRFDSRFNDSRPSGDPYHSNHFSFDTLALKVKYDSSTFFASAQYRFYGGSFIYGKRAGYQGYPGEVQFPMWGYVGYKITEKDSITTGLLQSPFGLTPYFGSSFLESLGFTMGIEEVYNLGVKYSHVDTGWTFDLGYFPGSAPNAIGISRDSARYSTAPVIADSYVPNGSNNHERNMVVARYEQSLLKTDTSSIVLGASGWVSELYNLDTRRSGTKTLGGVHVDAKHDGWGFKGIYVRQDISARNPGRDDMITVGGYDGSYNMAARGNFFSGEVNYQIPFAIGPFSAMPYYNYSVFLKDKDAFKTSQRHILGTAWTYKPDPRLVIYSEGIIGQNDPYVGAGQYTTGLAEGGDGKWKKAVIVNIGYYF